MLLQASFLTAISRFMAATTKSEMNRDYDIAVLGANGYVGHRLVASLVEFSKSSGLRILATARSPEKIRALKKEFPTIDFETLNVLSQDDVDRIVPKARIVVSCIGPFDLYGENVVSTCARTGTHYLDITGEIIFIRRMIERYDETAKKAGAMLVPFAGFDTVPSDLSVFLAAHEMKTAHDQELASIDLIYKVKGGFNGGTAATAIDMGSKLSAPDQKNLNFLAPAEPAKNYNELYSPRYVNHLRQWVAPFFMESINNKVIYRTIALYKESACDTASMNGDNLFSKDFSYRESLHVPGGFLAVAAVATSLATVQALLKTSVGRRLASFVVPAPGQGPTERQMQEGFFQATVVATGSRGKVMEYKMTSSGDPGNVSTVKMLMACLRALTSKNDQIKNGFQTPASAFGVALLPALRDSGVVWE